MAYLLSITVFLLMVFIGMSVDRTQFLANWRRFTPAIWLRLLAATFIVPPLLALALGSLLPIDRSALVGLYLIAVAPGAPLMTRNVAQHGFDMQLAATYQVWGALLSPVMIPLLVGFAAWLYGRSIWIPPGEVLRVIARQQFAPLLLGMLLMHFAPGFSSKARPILRIAGNVLVALVVLLLLVTSLPALKEGGLWPPIAALLLALGCMAAGLAIARTPTPATRTLVVSNVNRHVGLALLLAGTHFHTTRAFPTVLSYALLAPLVMAVYGRCVLRGRAS